MASWHRNASSDASRIALSTALTGSPNAVPDGAQQVVRVELRAHELDGDDLGGVELLEEAPHDRRLAGADLAGDDDEPLALVEPVLEVRERALVAPAAVVERRIGVELEGLAGEPEEGFVHRAAHLNV